MNKNKIKINIIDTKKINILLIIFVLTSLFVYLYSYQISVSHASSIESVKDKISNLKSEISEVEFRTVESKRLVDKEVAISEGFVPINEIIFIKKTPKTALNAISN